MKVGIFTITLIAVLTHLSGCNGNNTSTQLEGLYRTSNDGQGLEVTVSHVGNGEATIRAVVNGGNGCTGDTDVIPGKVRNSEINVATQDCKVTFRLLEDGRAEIKEKDCSLYHGAACSFDATNLQRVISKTDPDTDTAQQVNNQESEPSNNEQFFNGSQFWVSDWGSGIKAALTKNKCKDSSLEAEGYTFVAYTSIPITRAKNKDQIWYKTEDGAVTVLGCWKYLGNGQGHYKILRRKMASHLKKM